MAYSVRLPGMEPRTDAEYMAKGNLEREDVRARRTNRYRYGDCTPPLIYRVSLFGTSEKLRRSCSYLCRAIHESPLLPSLPFFFLCGVESGHYAFSFNIPSPVHCLNFRISRYLGT